MTLPMRHISMLLDPAALAWLLLIGLGILCWRRRQRLGGALLLVFCLVWWVIELMQCPARLVASLENPYRNIDGAEPQKAAAVIVLGGSATLADHEFAGLDFEWTTDRVLTGVHLIRQKRAKVLVLGGGSDTRDPAGPGEGERLSAWLKDWGVTKGEVLSLPPSRNTRDEALNAASLAKQEGWERVILVTSAWHMKRASAAFRKEGLVVVPYGCDFVGSNDLRRARRFVPQTRSLALLQLWLHEFIGYPYYRIRGWA